MSLRRRLLSLSLAAVATAAVVPLAASPAGAAPAKPKPPRVYYLALGDSLAYGYKGAQIAEQVAAGSIDPDSFPGYVEPFAADFAAATGHKVETVNLSCPGETTTSIRVGCGFSEAYGVKALHDRYAGSQLDAALAFLRAHGGKTAVISLSLGSNDLNNALNSCRPQLATGGIPAFAACVQSAAPAAAATMIANLAALIGELRAAAPGATIAVFDIYNPQAPVLPFTEALLAPINTALTGVVAAQGAELAPAYQAINGAGPAPVCVLTAYCTVQDIHPTDAGYAALAAALEDAVGIG